LKGAKGGFQSATGKYKKRAVADPNCVLKSFGEKSRNGGGGERIKQIEVQLIYNIKIA